MNNYMKLLTDLSNKDEVIKDENKMLILLSFLLDEEYETFILMSMVRFHLATMMC